MAAGTSSPELFTSLVALAGPVADIGTGTVVGSGKKALCEKKKM